MKFKDKVKVTSYIYKTGACFLKIRRKNPKPSKHKLQDDLEDTEHYHEVN